MKMRYKRDSASLSLSQNLCFSGLIKYGGLYEQEEEK